MNKENMKFIYNNITFLLILIITNNILFKYKTLNNLQKYEIFIYENELFLRFKKSIWNQSIIYKHIKMKRVINEFIFQFIFINIFRITLRNTEYYYIILIYIIRY